MRRAILLCALCFVAMPAAAQTSAAWPLMDPPRPLPAHDVKFPPYDLQTLPNGLQVVAVLHHEQPAVSMRLLVRAGSAADPKDKLGLAKIAADLLDQGTTTKSAEQMNDAIDFIGGAMGAAASPDLSQMSIVVMKDSFETGMRMLSDMARNPAFSPIEIDRQKQQALSGLQVSLQDPEYIANAVFDRMVYGFHPYGLPQSGTPDTLAAITHSDLAAFHQQYFVPNNAILAIVGDVTAEEAFSTAKKVFGDWAQRDVVPQKFAEPPEPTRRVIVVNKPDAVQTEVRVGHLGIPRKHADYMAVNLAIRILGGEGSNRLHQVLRTERGLTYGAQAQFDTLKESGDFEAETNTRSEATGEVLRLIIDEFWRLQRERVSERELTEAKNYLTGSFPLTIETPDAIARQVLNVLFYGLPIEELQTIREQVNAVTVDDIQRVARTYLKPDRLSIVLVGNAAAFGSQLKGIGFPNVETIELDNLDLTTANFQRPKRVNGAGAPILRTVSFQQPRSIAPDPGPNAQALLEKVIVAKGGLATLRGLKTITAVTAETVQAPTGPLEAQTTTFLQYPDHVRIERKLTEGVGIQVFDGEHGWIKDPRGIRAVSDLAIRQMQTTLERDTIAALLAAHDGRLRARLLPDVKDESGTLRHALELSANTVEPFVLYIDPATNLIGKEAYVSGEPGQPLVEEIYSDYRPVDGVQIAFSGAMRRAGQRLVTRRVTALTINTLLDPSLFKRPGS
ncbi:MAG TPA: pitrilysin family protein [Vicinamibacterales bacterium]